MCVCVHVCVRRTMKYVSVYFKAANIHGLCGVPTALSDQSTFSKLQ